MSGSRIRLYGSTSGYVELEAPAVGDDGVLVLPTAADGFGAAGIGSNVVQTVKTDTFSTTSSTFVDVTGLTATITPSSATSKILIIASVAWSIDAGDGRKGAMKLAGGNTAAYVGDAAGSRTRAVTEVWQDSRAGFEYNRRYDVELETLVYVDSPATTSPTTYSVQVAETDVSASPAIYINRSAVDSNSADFVRAASTITVIEVAA